MMKSSLMADENMSVLTSASCEISASSASTIQAPISKKKRSLPGNPDPEAEVVALSPKSLVATNRFMCEICNKGFQRDQNLQLHRRGHNLPWKLKKRTSKEVKIKKVYICPEQTCVHHHPSRALGDLTGIKKHFFRKHGEKKWKCDKCSKRYAVQTDWKAHSKICGTREYRCDCGTLFSRRDSFITHRAFCNALAEESVRAITGINPLLNLSSSQPVVVKREEGHQYLNSTLNHDQVPPWLTGLPSLPPLNNPAPLFSTNHLDHGQSLIHHHHQNQNQNPNPNASTSSQMNATAILQNSSPLMLRSLQPPLMSSGVHYWGLSSRDQDQLAASGFMAELQSSHEQCNQSSLLQDMMNSVNGFEEQESSTLMEEALHGMLKTKKESDRDHLVGIASKSKESGSHDVRASNGSEVGGLTIDFMGVRGFSHKDFFNLDALHHDVASASVFGQQNQNQTPPWRGQ